MKYVRILPVLLLAAPLAAQEPPRRLALEDALRIAEESNPEYRSAQAEVRVAEARQRQSFGAFLPGVSTSFSLGGSSARTWVGRDPFGKPLPSEQATEQVTSNASQGVDVSIPIFERGRVGEVRASRADRASATAQVAVERDVVRAEVTRRYHAAVRAERMIELEERLLASARERLEATQRLFRIAAQGMTEVLGAEVEVARQEQVVEQARGDARKAKLALGEAMGVIEAADARLTSEPVPVFDPSGLRADSVVALALRVQPRLAGAASAVTAAEHRVGVSRGQRWPVLAARTGLSRSVYGGDSEAFTIFDPSSHADRLLSLGFTVSLPVFDQYRSSTQVAQAEATRARAQETLRSTRLSVERGVRGALIDLENAFRGSQLAERAAKLSQDRLELAREQYRVNAIRFIDLQSVVDRAAQAERDALSARFQFADALASLEEQVGTPVRP
ncbi:MAG: TolC family protein [Gemmatimonadetes bacterium]|nr:TolC family protein [Gemmatimonadota bacterium]